MKDELQTLVQTQNIKWKWADLSNVLSLSKNNQ